MYCVRLLPCLNKRPSFLYTSASYCHWFVSKALWSDILLYRGTTGFKPLERLHVIKDKSTFVIYTNETATIWQKQTYINALSSTIYRKVFIQGQTIEIIIYTLWYEIRLLTRYKQPKEVYQASNQFNLGTKITVSMFSII